MSVAEHEAFLRRLEVRLGYLDADQLVALGAVIEANAGGAGRNVWPAEISIANWAATLQPPPEGEDRLVVSWLGSAAGLRAWEEGPEVAMALRRHLRRKRRPPGPHDMAAIRETAGDWRHRRDAAAERLASGLGGQAERDLVRSFDETAELVRGLVFAKREGCAE